MKVRSHQRQALPLCSSYFGVIFDCLDIWVQREDEPQVHSIQWATGLLADGELELLGAWSLPSEQVGPEYQFLKELKARGVEVIRLIVSADRAVGCTDAIAVYPKSRALPSFQTLLSESLSQVAPLHRQAVGNALRLVIATDSLELAVDALDVFAASTLGRRYAALVVRWRVALVDSEPFFALGPRHRHMLLLGDEFVRGTHERVRRSFSRSGRLPSSAGVSSLVEASLVRIGHRLPRHRATLGSDVVGYSVRLADGPLAASH